MKIRKEKIEELKEKMQKEKESIQTLMRTFAKENKEGSGDWQIKFPDFKAAGVLDEEADEVEEYSSLLAIEEKFEKKLQKINQALKKIREKKYGLCENCQKEISAQRLKLVPEAKFCNQCKNIHL